MNSWGKQRDFFLREKHLVIFWETAQELLCKDTVTGGKQYHTGWLTIYTNNGKKYVTKQPAIDEFYRFTKQKKINVSGFGSE